MKTIEHYKAYCAIAYVEPVVINITNKQDAMDAVNKLSRAAIDNSAKASHDKREGMFPYLGIFVIDDNFFFTKVCGCVAGKGVTSRIYWPLDGFAIRAPDQSALMMEDLRSIFKMYDDDRRRG